jgi:hypothetical protein
MRKTRTALQADERFLHESSFSLKMNRSEVGLLWRGRRFTFKDCQRVSAGECAMELGVKIPRIG